MSTPSSPATFWSFYDFACRVYVKVVFILSETSSGNTVYMKIVGPGLKLTPTIPRVSKIDLSAFAYPEAVAFAIKGTAKIAETMLTHLTRGMARGSVRFVHLPSDDFVYIHPHAYEKFGLKALRSEISSRAVTSLGKEMVAKAATYSAAGDSVKCRPQLALSKAKYMSDEMGFTLNLRAMLKSAREGIEAARALIPPNTAVDGDMDFFSYEDTWALASDSLHEFFAPCVAFLNNWPRLMHFVVGTASARLQIFTNPLESTEFTEADAKELESLREWLFERIEVHACGLPRFKSSCYGARLDALGDSARALGAVHHEGKFVLTTQPPDDAILQTNAGNRKRYTTLDLHKLNDQYAALVKDVRRGDFNFMLTLRNRVHDAKRSLAKLVRMAAEVDRISIDYTSLKCNIGSSAVFQFVFGCVSLRPGALESFNGKIVVLCDSQPVANESSFRHLLPQLQYAFLCIEKGAFIYVSGYLTCTSLRNAATWHRIFVAEKNKHSAVIIDNNTDFEAARNDFLVHPVLN